MAGEYRISDYEGTPDANIGYAEQGFTGDYGGVASYYSSDSPVIGSTCMTLDGQGGLYYDNTFPARTYWTGWWRSNSAPTSNRLLVNFSGELSSQVQASISIDTARKWRLRNQVNTAVHISTTTFTDGVWYGMVWWVDYSTGTQEMKLYDASGTLLETLSGGCGTTALARQREGILQGNNDWSCSFDQTAIGSEPIALTMPGGGVQEEEGEAGFSGAGTLTSTGKPSPEGSGTFTGTGELQASGAALISAAGSADLSGSGILEASGEPFIELSDMATLTGAGELAVNGNPFTTGEASFSSTGVLGAEGEALLEIGDTVNLSGTGTLSVSTSVDLGGSCGLSGTGVLSAPAKPSAGGTAALAGEGELTASADFAPKDTANLSGSGELTAVGESSEQAVGAAELEGSGLLDTTAIVNVTGGASLDGEGALGLAAGSATASVVPLIGSGQLDVEQRSVHVDGTAPLASSGILQLGATASIRGDVELSGSGQFSSTTGQHAVAAVALSGSGTQARTTVPGWHWVMWLPSTGQLTVIGKAVHHYTGAEASFSGEGTLATAMSFGVPRDVEVSARLGDRIRGSATLRNRRWEAKLE